MIGVIDLPKKFAAPYAHPSTGTIVLTLKDEAETVYVHGDLKLPRACLPENALFEIGSITKVFTAILLARLVGDQLIDPERPIGSICTEFAGAPEWITPRNLATHTSGLPRLHVPVWKLLFAGVPADPYADFGHNDLVAWMRRWRPARPPRRGLPAYSNLGAGLLGAVLASSQGRTYEALLREKVIAPLGLADTAINLDEDQKKRFAQPHSAAGKQVVPWTFQAFAGAGALRASAADLAQFARRVIAASARSATPIDRAITLSVEPVVPLGPGGGNAPIAQCLGWIGMTLRPAGPRMLFHDGGTAGSSSALYVCPERKAAIIVLANRGGAAGLLSNLRLMLSNPNRLAYDYFAAQ